MTIQREAVASDYQCAVKECYVQGALLLVCLSGTKVPVCGDHLARALEVRDDIGKEMLALDSRFINSVTALPNVHDPPKEPKGGKS